MRVVQWCAKRDAAADVLDRVTTRVGPGERRVEGDARATGAGRADGGDQAELRIVEAGVDRDLLTDDHVGRRGDLDARRAGGRWSRECPRRPLGRADRRDAARGDVREVDAE